MSGKKAFAVLAIATALWVLGTTSAAWSSFNHHHHRGGFVMPCSLDGVNPVYHPDIFGNPAVASSYGFVLGPDRAWHVRSNCRSY
jgi:hypothetical protein